MKRLVVLFLLGAWVCLRGQAMQNAGSVVNDHAVGILQSVENATVALSGEDLVMARKDKAAPVQMTFTRCQGLGVRREDDQWWVLPISATGAHISTNKALWVLPLDVKSGEKSWDLQLQSGVAEATKTEKGLTVVIGSDRFTLHPSEARPHSDVFNRRFALTINGGHELEDALAGFYWGTMLPSVVEKTMAANFPYSSGYVLSTLKVSSYAGSYPAVDHEFQIKGRLAMGSEADLDIVRRMIELQFKLMNDDPERLYRAPTSVQPDGRREYHVRRNSKDNHHNAAMFPLTGNIEVLEEAWHYYEARKDRAWLQMNIGNLEAAGMWIQENIDQYGRVWSDVYYEDQVIKDGRVTQAQAFTAHVMELLSRMEKTLGRQSKADNYSALSKKISGALIKPIPMGYWDDSNHRFVDWIDRDGKVHDHVHLLANTLPLTFGYATPGQVESVSQLIAHNDAEFERFPSFLAADIAGYTLSEIGDGGPYDLCAAGRYWYWDAAYRESRAQDDVLFHQLMTVAAEGAMNNYFMGERYDMDHVYYVDGKDAHGAEQYYEYPNVYAAVLISKFLGLTIPADADVAVSPHITSYGSVEMGTTAYALRYTYSKDGFVLQNLSDERRRFKVDLAALGRGGVHYHLIGKTGGGLSSPQQTVVLAPHSEAKWTSQP